MTDLTYLEIQDDGHLPQVRIGSIPARGLMGPAHGRETVALGLRIYAAELPAATLPSLPRFLRLSDAVAELSMSDSWLSVHFDDILDVDDAPLVARWFHYEPQRQVLSRLGTGSDVLRLIEVADGDDLFVEVKAASLAAARRLLQDLRMHEADMGGVGRGEVPPASSLRTGGHRMRGAGNMHARLRLMGQPAVGKWVSLESQALPAQGDVVAARREALLALGWPTSQQVGERAGSCAQSNPAQYASQLRQAGRILGVWSPRDRTYLHPVFQFDESGQPRPRVAELLAVMGNEEDDPKGWNRVFWLYGPHLGLEGATPAECFAKEPARVIALAQEDFGGDPRALV